MLVDVSQDRVLRDGKRPWREHRMDAQKLAIIYRDIDSAKAGRLDNCGTLLGYQTDSEGELRLAKANFCHVRLCPMCAWRRSLKLYAQMSCILDYMQEHGSYRYLFLTLTLRNCDGKDLSATLDKLYEGWRRLQRYPEFNARRKDSCICGIYKTIEVTHNVNSSSLSYNTYHPHIHAIIAVKPSYFAGRNYCTHRRLMEIWKQAAKLDYDPQVCIKAIKGSTADEFTKAVAEVCKYSVKSADYLIPSDWQLSHDTVALLDKALAGRRFVGMTGIFRITHKLLHLDDPDTGDLIHTEPEYNLYELDPRIIWYVWHVGYNEYILER